MIGFYYGTSVPGANAKEGIYFINQNDKYSIYVKRTNENLIKYAETNELVSENLTNLWEQIGNTFVAKTFTVAGLSLENNITLAQLQEALKLKALAYKDEATGTLSDYVIEVEGINYTPTGLVEINLGEGEKTTLLSKGLYTPKGSINGSVVTKGSVTLQKDSAGFAISGSVSAPEITITPSTTSIKTINSVGSLPSYTPAQYTPPSLNSENASFATEGVVASMNGSTLRLIPAATAQAVNNITFNQGNYTVATFNAGTLPTIKDNVTVVNGISTATASAPIFTGDKLKANFIEGSSEINATFTGIEEEIQVFGEYEKTSIDSIDFKGNAIEFKPNLIKENKNIIVK